jgi:micrococcal nuclease
MKSLLAVPCRWAAFLLFCLLLAASLVQAESLQVKVLYVYDGDTLRVSGVGKVRLLGIDTPERERSERDQAFIRQGANPARLSSAAAAARTRVVRLAQGQRVKLTFDHERHDRYGRTLAYVTLPDGRLLNQLLLEEGHAIVYRRFDFRLKKEFLAAEERARSQGVGMWRGANKRH